MAPVNRGQPYVENNLTRLAGLPIPDKLCQGRPASVKAKHPNPSGHKVGQRANTFDFFRGIPPWANCKTNKPREEELSGNTPSFSDMEAFVTQGVLVAPVPVLEQLTLFQNCRFWQKREWTIPWACVCVQAQCNLLSTFPPSGKSKACPGRKRNPGNCPLVKHPNETMSEQFSPGVPLDFLVHEV